jgi:hypothetical protein
MGSDVGKMLIDVPVWNNIKARVHPVVCPNNFVTVYFGLSRLRISSTPRTKL